MKTKFANWMKTAKGLGTLVSVGVVIVTGLFLQNVSSSLKQANNFQNALETCFSRVKQTYTSRLIGDKENGRTGRSFLKTTEDCFADTAIASEGVIASQIVGVTKRLNNLISETHWFNKRVDANDPDGIVGKTPELVLLANIGNKFEEIEGLFDTLWGQVEDYKVEGHANLTYGKVFFFIFSVLSFLLLSWSIIRNRKRSHFLISLERKAKDLVELEVSPGEEEVSGILSEVLTHENYENCHKLLGHYKNALETRLEKHYDNSKSLSTPHFEMIREEDVNEQVERLWNDPSYVIQSENSIDERFKALDKVQISGLIDRTIERFSNEAFQKGIFINFDSEQDLCIFGHNEGLEQIVYHSLQLAIKSVKESEFKNIDIKLKVLGSTVICEFINSGKPENNNFIGLEMELEIVEELIEEFHGKVQFSDIVGGLKMKMVFHLAKKSNDRKLVSVVKGKKKDILKAMQESF